MAFVSVSNNFDGVIYWVRTQKLAVMIVHPPPHTFDGIIYRMRAQKRAVMIAPFDSPSSMMYNLPDESTETRDQDSPR